MAEGGGGERATGAAAAAPEALRAPSGTPDASTKPNVPLAPEIVDRKVAAPRPRWVLLASAAVLATALAYVFAGKFWVSKHVTAERQAPVSTAVVSDKCIYS